MKDTIRFGDFAEVNPSIRLERGKEYPYIEMADVILGDAFVYPQEKRAYKGGGSRFQSGDTLFARITPCLENGKIVRLSHTDDQPCFGSTEFFVFRGKPNISDSTYIFYLALSPMIREHAIKSMTGATGRQRVLNQCFDDYFLPNPNQDILDQFESTVIPLFRKVQNLAEKNTNLRQTRDLLLPKLISGEIDVSELDIDTDAM